MIFLNRRNDTKPTVWRRLFHVCASGSIPLAGIFIEIQLMVVVLAALSTAAVVIEMARFRSPALNGFLTRGFRPLLKDTETRSFTGATYILIGALVSFLIFEKSIAISVLFFVSLGDPIAALIGQRAKGYQVFGKSPVGTVGFIVVSLCMVAILSWAGAVPYQWPILVGACAAGLTELLPLPIDDNLMIPLVSGGLITLLV